MGPPPSSRPIATHNHTARLSGAVGTSQREAVTLLLYSLAVPQVGLHWPREEAVGTRCGPDNPGPAASPARAGRWKPEARAKAIRYSLLLACRVSIGPRAALIRGARLYGGRRRWKARRNGSVGWQRPLPQWQMLVGGRIPHGVGLQQLASGFASRLALLATGQVAGRAGC